jgi:hypothetical protein
MFIVDLAFMEHTAIPLFDTDSRCGFVDDEHVEAARRDKALLS